LKSATWRIKKITLIRVSGKHLVRTKGGWNCLRIGLSFSRCGTFGFCYRCYFAGLFQSYSR
jgi:hypothetical protein